MVKNIFLLLTSLIQLVESGSPKPIVEGSSPSRREVNKF